MCKSWNAQYSSTNLSYVMRKYFTVQITADVCLLRLAETCMRSVCACNPFGGTESCMTLAPDSQSAQTCPGHNLKACSIVHCHSSSASQRLFAAGRITHDISNITAMHFTLSWCITQLATVLLKAHSYVLLCMTCISQSTTPHGNAISQAQLYTIWKAQLV